MTDEELEAEVGAILDSLGGQLQARDHANIRRFIGYGEYVLAVETLCDQVCESGLALDRTVYDALVRLAKACGIDSSYVRHLPKPS